MHSSLLRRGLSAALLAVAAGNAAAATPATAEATAEAVFDAYVAAVHAGDLQAVRALIAPDVARSDFVGCTPAMDNPACLAHYIQATVIAPRARLTELRRSREGDTLSAEVEVRSPLYTAAGVERIVGRDVLRVQGGLIRDFRFIPDFRDAPTTAFFATLGIGPGAARATSKP